MPDVIVVCEGHTERAFCRDVLAPEFANRGVFLRAMLLGKQRGRGGGIVPWAICRRELEIYSREHATWHVALLVDYYAMPHDWPGRATAPSLPPDQRGRHVEQQLVATMRAASGDRFHPCVQVHEFESLLFVDPAATVAALAAAAAIEPSSRDRTIAALQRIVADAGGVERIDDHRHSSPARRIRSLVAGYDKVAWGPLAAAAVTLPVLRRGCPWLGRWLDALDSLAPRR